jgi:hypothetical protein
MSRERGKGFLAHLFMPEDVLPSLLPFLLAERLRYVVFYGTPLFRGKCEIESYRFEAMMEVEYD